MSARPLWLGALVLLSAGCGAEAREPNEAGGKTVRIQMSTRLTAAGSATHEFRSSGTYDYGNNRGTHADPTTGCRTITIGKRTYTEVPAAVGLPGGKRWVLYDATGSDLEAEFEKSLEDRTTTLGDGSVVRESSMIMIAPDGPGPEQYLHYLQANAKEGLDLVAEEELRGEQTAHYRGEVDGERTLRAYLEANGWKPANIGRYLEQSIESPEIVDLWVGADGLARRVVSTTRNPVGHTSYESVTTTDYLDYGLEVSIEAPPAAEVLDSTAWQGTVVESNVDRSCLH